jgi:predicted anti-sigma-YlaC factor YlaD
MTPHPGDELVDLVLGHVDGRRRAELAAHLLECPACRQDYDELSRAVSDATTQVPPVQPPVGFDAAVLRTIAEAAPVATDTRRPSRRRRWLAVAAAVLVLVAGAGVVFAYGRGAGDELATVVALRLDDGGAVGTVSLGDVDGEPVMVVAITDAPAGVSYACRMHLRDGTVVESDPWPAVPEGAWIVDVPASGADVERVELVVSGTDHVWSSAEL